MKQKLSDRLNLLLWHFLWLVFKPGDSVSFTCLQVFPASEVTNMLMSLSDSSVPILPVRWALVSEGTLSETAQLANQGSKSIYLFFNCRTSGFGRKMRRKGRGKGEGIQFEKNYIKDAIHTTLHTSICRGNALISSYTHRSRGLDMISVSKASFHKKHMTSWSPMRSFIWQPASFPNTGGVAPHSHPTPSTNSRVCPRLHIIPRQFWHVSYLKLQWCWGQCLGWRCSLRCRGCLRPSSEDEGSNRAMEKGEIKVKSRYNNVCSCFYRLKKLTVSFCVSS